jgi:hypothetical protein
MYHLGYILFDQHPVLKTIVPEEIPQINDKPILIVGFSNAYNLYPQTTIDNKTIDEEKKLYYCFSKEEAPDKYQEYVDNFIAHCFEFFTRPYKVIKTKNPVSIETQLAFIYETSNILTISTTEKEIYYFNKEISSFFNPTFQVEALSKLKAKLIIGWDRDEYFGAYLKTIDDYVPLQFILKLLQPYGDIELYLGQYCLQWIVNNIDKINKEELKVWLRAYKVENLLSKIKIKVNEERVKYLASNIDNIIANNIYEAIQEGYIIQHYNGTDKTTGRIYPKDDGYSLQSLHKDYRDIVIAEKKCILCEFDYKYFEYYLLAQICNIPIQNDPHEHLAIELFNDKSMRQVCKTINYAILYNKNIDKVVDEIITEHSIQLSKKELKDKLLGFIKPIKGFEEGLLKQYDEKGFIVNYFCRKIKPTKRYACLNNYIQSTAADYLLIKLEKLFNYLKGENKLVLQIHDSIILNLSIEDINNSNLLEDIQTILTQEECGLTAQTGFKYGNNWKDLK